MWRLLKSFRTLSRDTEGGVLMYFALLTPIFLGFMGLVVDLAVWNLNKRTVQNTADAAAIAAVLEIKRSGIENVSGAINEVTQANGFGQGNDVLTVNNPPAAGPLSGSENAVEVVLTRKVPTFLSSVFIKGPVTVAARATAVGKPSDVCVLALDQGMSGAISISGNSEVNLDCKVVANSKSGAAIRQIGDSCMEAKGIQASGGISGDCLSPNPVTGRPYIPDPLSALKAPETDDCDYETTFRVNGAGETSLEPGNYCGGIMISGSGDVEFEAGLYVIGGIGLQISGSASVTGTDVAFYLTASSGGLDITGGGSVTLAADETGDLPGVLFYQDRNSQKSTNRIAGGGDMRLEGILYFPMQDLVFAGGTETEPTASLLIANSVAFIGNTEIEDVDESPAMANSGLFQAYLVQ
jgi:hypothetical protein